MAWFSFHGGHSGQFCRHAKGRLEEVVVMAIARGFTTYGLTEHVARDEERHLYPGEEDLGVEGLRRLFDDYLAEARRLRGVYADRIELLLGFEAEAVPEEGGLERMRAIRAGLPDCDFVIGSVHHVNEVAVDFSAEQTARLAEEVGGREALEVAYFERVAEVATQLAPEVIGHFDLVRRFQGAEPTFGPGAWQAIGVALEAVRASGAALDVNAAPARRGFGPVYPLLPILERARSMGIPVTLGDDSHAPGSVGIGLDACLAAIARAGYREVACLVREGNETGRILVPIDEVRPAVVKGG